MRHRHFRRAPPAPMLELRKERRAKKRAAKRGEAPSQEAASDDVPEPQPAQR